MAWMFYVGLVVIAVAIHVYGMSSGAFPGSAGGNHTVFVYAESLGTILATLLVPFLITWFWRRWQKRRGRMTLLPFIVAALVFAVVQAALWLGERADAQRMTAVPFTHENCLEPTIFPRAPEIFPNRPEGAAQAFLQEGKTALMVLCQRDTGFQAEDAQVLQVLTQFAASLGLDNPPVAITRRGDDIIGRAKGVVNMKGQSATTEMMIIARNGAFLYRMAGTDTDAYPSPVGEAFLAQQGQP
jgi:hypothetical protein